MNIHSTETLDQTLEMRLLTDAELNHVNGGLYFIAALLSLGFGFGVGSIIFAPSDGPLPEMPIAA